MCRSGCTHTETASCAGDSIVYCPISALQHRQFDFLLKILVKIMAQLIQLLPLLVLLLLSPARGGASGDAAAACEAGGVGELAARLARLEQLVAEIHAAVVYAPASTPAAAPLPAPASQWVTADNQISESTIHFMFGLWDDGAAMPRHFQGGERFFEVVGDQALWLRR